VRDDDENCEGSKMKSLIIVTPVWNEDLEPHELLRISMTIANNVDVPHAFIGPEDKKFVNILEMFPKSTLVSLPASNFASVASYSKMLMDPKFYELFNEFEYLLICQLDAILIKNTKLLTTFGYDYVGSVWEKGYSILKIGKILIVNHQVNRILKSDEIFVGNGGLSLRRTESMFWLTSKIEAFNSQLKEKFPEDILISYFGKKDGLRIPAYLEADEIFREKTAIGLTEIPAIYGFHALGKYNPILENRLFNVS